jgi:hypothetical protein
MSKNMLWHLWILKLPFFELLWRLDMISVNKWLPASSLPYAVFERLYVQIFMRIFQINLSSRNTKYMYCFFYLDCFHKKKSWISIYSKSFYLSVSMSSIDWYPTWPEWMYVTGSMVIIVWMVRMVENKTVDFFHFFLLL